MYDGKTILNLNWLWIKKSSFKYKNWKCHAFLITKIPQVWMLLSSFVKILNLLKLFFEITLNCISTGINYVCKRNASENIFKTSCPNKIVFFILSINEYYKDLVPPPPTLQTSTHLEGPSQDIESYNYYSWLHAFVGRRAGIANRPLKKHGGGTLTFKKDPYNKGILFPSDIVRCRSNGTNSLTKSVFLFLPRRYLCLSSFTFVCLSLSVFVCRHPVPVHSAYVTTVHVQWSVSVGVLLVDRQYRRTAWSEHPPRRHRTRAKLPQDVAWIVAGEGDAKRVGPHQDDHWRESVYRCTDQGSSNFFSFVCHV